MTEIPVKMTLSNRMLVAVFVIMAFFIVTIGVLSYKGFKKEFRKDVENNLNAILNLKVAEIVQWRKERIADGSAFMANQSFSDLVNRFIASPLNPDLPDRLGKWLKQMRSAYAYECISLLDTRGNKLISEPLQLTPVTSHLINDINIVGQTQKVTILDFHRDGHDGPIRLEVLVPVQSPEDPDKIIAVMVFVINPEVYLYPLIKIWPTSSRTAETLILRREGDSVLFLNELKFQKNAALNLRFSINNATLPAARAALGNEGIFTGINYRGVPVISSLRTIPDSPWNMVALVDIKEVFAPLNTKWWTMFIVVVLLILSFASIMFSLWRRQRIRYFNEKYESEREKAKTDKDLEESEHKFRETVKYLDEGYYSVSIDGYLLDHNQAFNRILGFDIGQDLKGAILPDFWQNPDERKVYLDELIARGFIRNYLINAKTISGEKIVVLANSHLVKDEQGRLVRIEGTYNDFTERKQAEEEIIKLNAELEDRIAKRTNQLEAANKELEAFAYSVSHDLRAPLRAVDGFSKFVLEDYENKLDSEGKRLLNLIRSNTQKMDQLITDLLALSRVTRSELNVSGIDMTQMAISMFKEIAPDVPDKIRLKVDPLPEAYADPTYIRQVWANLIANAIKFSSKEKKPSIKIHGHTENGFNNYYINDNGVGFNPEYTHKLFGVFQRLHKSDDFEGTGVGLAIIQRIIHRHGGKVWAEGKEGKGATFWFSLPIKK